MDLGLDIRKDILARALMLENLTSFFLGELLGIKDIKNSRTLGSKSSSISFNQKIDLLIDLGALSTEIRKKFQVFMEIRNQFMHNLNATSYVECYSFLLGTDRFVLRLYPQPEDLPAEPRLPNASLSLADDVLSITAQLIKGVKNNIRKDVEGETAKNSNKAFIDSIKSTHEVLDKMIQKIISESETISTKKLRGLGRLVSRLMYSNWHKHFHSLKSNSAGNKSAEVRTSEQ